MGDQAQPTAAMVSCCWSLPKLSPLRKVPALGFCSRQRSSDVPISQSHLWKGGGVVQCHNEQMLLNSEDIQKVRGICFFSRVLVVGLGGLELLRTHTAINPNPVTETVPSPPPLTADEPSSASPCRAKQRHGSWATNVHATLNSSSHWETDGQPKPSTSPSLCNFLMQTLAEPQIFAKADSLSRSRTLNPEIPPSAGRRRGRQVTRFKGAALGF